MKAKTLRPGHADASGAAREVEFCTLEAELDHLQLQSANQSTFVAAGSVQPGTFNNDVDQDTWLKASSASVTMDIDPRLHEIKDLDNKSFRSTGSYKSFEGVAAKLVPALFKNGLGEGRQKAAHAAALLGLVSFDDVTLTKNIHERIADAGFVVTPALAQSIDAAIKLPRQRLLFDQGLSSGTAKSIAAWLQQGLGVAPALDYELPKTKRRLQQALEALGYVVDPTTTALLDSMTAQKVPPAQFEQQLARLPQLNDAQMLAGFAGSAPRCAGARAQGRHRRLPPAHRGERRPRQGPGHRRRRQSSVATLVPTLKQVHVAYSTDLQAMVRAAVDGGGPAAILLRAFQHLGTQSLAQALRMAGVYLVGVKIPALEVDKASVAQALSTTYQGYTGVFPSWTAFVDDATKAGLQPTQAIQYAQQAMTYGSLSAARSRPQLLNLPDPPVDVAAFCAFVAAPGRPVEQRHRRLCQTAFRRDVAELGGGADAPAAAPRRRRRRRHRRQSPPAAGHLSVLVICIPTNLGSQTLDATPSLVTSVGDRPLLGPLQYQLTGRPQAGDHPSPRRRREHDGH